VNPDLPAVQRQPLYEVGDTVQVVWSSRQVPLFGIVCNVYEAEATGSVVYEVASGSERLAVGYADLAKLVKTSQ
jgi:hypothetical protein